MQPTIGTSLFLEIEFSSSDSDSEDQPQTLNANENAFLDIEKIEGDRKSRLNEQKVKIIGKTNFQYLMKRRVQKMT